MLVSARDKDFSDLPERGTSALANRCEPILTRSALIEKQPWYEIEEEQGLMVLGKEEGKEKDGRPPSLQGDLTVRKYRAYHVASAPRRVTPMTQVVPEGSQPRWRGRASEGSVKGARGKRGDAREERIVEPVQMEKKVRFAKEKEEEEEEEEEEEKKRRRWRRTMREWDERWYAKETYVPTRTPQDASCHARAFGPPMPRSW